MLKSKLRTSKYYATLTRVFLLSLVYVVSGRLALLLAIPPGFATALFPPIGIGIAACLLWGRAMLPGIYVGSLLLNISIALSSGAPFSIPVFFVAAEIALGSAAASLCAVWLIRRFDLYPNPLSDEWSIFAFFIIAAPVSCMVSASVGAIVLVLNGLIPAASFTFSWLTWWVGDSIGVLISIPFVFILFGKPRELWKPRLFTVGIPMFFSTAIIVYLFFYTSDSESNRSKSLFQAYASDIADNITDVFTNNTTAIMPMKGLFLASDSVTEKDFRIFASEVFKVAKGVKTLAWDAHVTSAELDSFIASHNQDYGQDFIPFATNNQKENVPLAKKQHYVLVTYIEPFDTNFKARGLDVSANDVRNEAIQQALMSGKPTMTAPIVSVQSNSGEYSYLVFLPVFKSVDTPKMVSMREQLILGYATAVIPMHYVFELIENLPNAHDLFVEIVDITDQANPVTVLTSGNYSKSRYAQLFFFQLEKEINGRKIEIHIRPGDGLFSTFESDKPWFVLVGGLLFVSLLGGFLLLVSGRAKLIEELVEERSKELDLILNSAVEGVLIFNGEGTVEKANPAACNMLSLQEHELLGARVVHLVPATQKLLEEQDMLLYDKSYQASWRQKETMVFCANNISIEFEIGVSGFALPDRLVFVLMLHDIRNRKKVDRMKNEFISTVSHELRTPLTSITGVLGLVAGGKFEGIPDKALDMLVIAKNNAERLGRLINDLLDMEKLELGQLKMSFKEAELNDLLNQSFEQNLGYAIKYGVHLALDNSLIAGELVFVRVDSDRFLQVMSNLISNAVKYSYLDGIVTVGAKIENQSIIVWVEDTGEGIPDEFRSRIFQKFAQADGSSTRKREGTGLGLSITQMIIERMGGEIHFSTELGKGTTFYFKLPLYKA